MVFQRSRILGYDGHVSEELLHCLIHFIRLLLLLLRLFFCYQKFITGVALVFDFLQFFQSFRSVNLNYLIRWSRRRLWCLIWCLRSIWSISIGIIRIIYCFALQSRVCSIWIIHTYYPSCRNNSLLVQRSCVLFIMRYFWNYFVVRLCSMSHSRFRLRVSIRVRIHLGENLRFIVKHSIWITCLIQHWSVTITILQAWSIHDKGIVMIVPVT